MRTAILVSGSRDWTDYDAIDARLKLYHPSKKTDTVILIHGDCGKYRKDDNGDWLRAGGDPMGEVLIQGADWIAAKLGARRGFRNHPYPYFDDWQKLGGPKRNECMFDVLVMLAKHGFAPCFEAFPMGGTGTAGMIRIVERYNGNDRRSVPIPIHVTR